MWALAILPGLGAQGLGCEAALPARDDKPRTDGGVAASARRTGGFRGAFYGPVPDYNFRLANFNLASAPASVTEIFGNQPRGSES